MGLRNGLGSPLSNRQGAPNSPNGIQQGSLRDRLSGRGGYQPQGSGIGGLRDRYAGALNQHPNQAAPGLSNQ